MKTLWLCVSLAACGGGGSDEPETPLERVQRAGGDVARAMELMCEPNPVEDFGNWNVQLTPGPKYQMWVRCERDKRLYVLTFEAGSNRPVEVEWSTPSR